MALKGYLGVYLTVFSCTMILVQPFYLESNDEPVNGKEFTITCNTSKIAVNWYRNNKYIGFSENQYTSVKPYECYIADPERYTFKLCGQEHELTIKSLNFDLDDGSVWRCRSLSGSLYSNNFTISILGFVDITSEPRSPIHGQQFTITCTTNLDNVTWYRNGQQLNFVYRSVDVNGCSKGMGDIGSLEATKCGYIYNLTIVQVDYYRDSGSVFQCRAGAKLAQYVIYVQVYPTFITTALPVDGNSFDITCFSIFDVSWYRKGMVEDDYIFIAASSLTLGCYYAREFRDDYKFESCGSSVNQTLTIKSVDFDRDNGSIWNCSFGKNYDSYTLTVTTPFLNDGNPYNSAERQVGDNCTFGVTYLEDSPLNVSWYRGVQKLETNNRVTIRKKPSTISHPYNNNIKLSGIRTIITITSVSITDEETYISRICNQYGCSSASFQLTIEAAAGEEVGGINVTVAVIVSVLAVALLVIGIFVFLKCRKYRASKQREHSEQNVYDSTVLTPGTVYDTLGLQNQYENSPSPPPSVYYNTVSGISKTEPLQEEADISNEYENQRAVADFGLVGP